MHIFHELGSAVEKSWRDASYDDLRFPRIAMEAIATAKLLDRVDPWEVVRWVHTTTEFPLQGDPAGNFGNPPITVFRGPRFYIDIYFWLDGTAKAHQHSFCGAFQVLLGGSIHTTFHFELMREISPHFLVGTLHTSGVELLERGDCRAILASDRFIHSLFHLERPSVSLVVRTTESPSGLPQFAYSRPHLAFDPFYNDALAVRRRQTAALLISVSHPRTDEMIAELIQHSDFATAFRVLELVYNSVTHSPIEAAMGINAASERYQALLELTRRRHGDLIDLIPPVFDEARRQNNVINRRSRVTDADHRFFLALLLNLDRRETLLELVAKRFPGVGPVDKILEWMDELTTTRVFGSSEPNVLGIANYDDDYRIVLQGLLEGMGFDAIKDRFTTEFSEESNDETVGKLAALFHSIPSELIFSSILSRADNTLEAAKRTSKRVRQRKS